MSSMGLFDEKQRSIVEAVDSIKKSLVVVDGWMTSIREAIAEEDWEDVVLGCGKVRMRLSECMQNVDKVNVVSSNESRENVIAGFYPRELTLGNDREIAKSADVNSLIRDVARGRIKDVRKAVESFKPKARNK